MTRMFAVALAASLVAGPALAQRHADIVYLQQQKAKQQQGSDSASTRSRPGPAAPVVESRPSPVPTQPKAADQEKPRN